MEKVWSRISDVFLLVAMAGLVLPLFTGLDLSADFLWLFLGPSIIIKESLDIQKDGRNIHSLLKISLCELIFVLSAYALLFD